MDLEEAAGLATSRWEVQHGWIGYRCNDEASRQSQLEWTMEYRRSFFGGE